MTTITVVPGAGLLIPDPDAKDYLPSGGRAVAQNEYWTRRLRDGDVTLSGSPPPPSPRSYPNGTPSWLNAPLLVGTLTTSAAANTAVLQAALDGGRKKIIIPDGLGVVYFAPIASSIPYGILQADDYTTLEVGAGTTLSLLPNAGGANLTYTLLCNRNAQSNSLSVTSIVAGSQDATTKFITCTVTTASPHGRSVGNFIQIKGDTSGFFNDVYEVISVPTSTTLTIKVFSYAPTMSNGAGTMILYPANAHITITGGGAISGGGENIVNGAAEGIANIVLALFNKVANCSFRLRSTFHAQRGVQFVNFYRCEVSPPGDMGMQIDSGGVGVQVTGPGRTMLIQGVKGDNTDDKVAVLTGDPSGVQFRDANNTINSGGSITGLTIRDISDRNNNTRTILIGADSSGHRLDGVKIYGVRRKHRGSGVMIELAAMNGGTVGVVDVYDAEMCNMNKTATASPGANGSIVYINGGSVSGTLEALTLYAPNGYGSTDTGSLGFVNNNIVSGNNSGGTTTINKITVVRPKVVCDLASSSYGYDLITWTGGTLALTGSIDVIDPDISCTGTSGSVGLISMTPNAAFNCNVRGGSLTMRKGSVVATNQSCTVNLFGSLVSGAATVLSAGGGSAWTVNIGGGADLSGLNGFGAVIAGGVVINTAGTSGSRKTAKITSGQVNWGGQFIVAQLAQYVDIQFYGAGGNISPNNPTPFYNNIANDGGSSNNNIYKLYGNCSEFPVNGTKVSPQSGCVFQNIDASYSSGVGLYGVGPTATARIAA